MTLTAQYTLAQILQSGGGLVPHPAGPKMRAPESLIHLVKAHRDEIRAILAMSLTEYAENGVPLAVLVPWAPQRFALTPNCSASRASIVSGHDRWRTQ
jgi:ribulose 1,5-bisphosphate carboxylase large subunit-like protein